MSKILVASTIPAFAMEQRHWKWWISNGLAMKAKTQEAGHEMDWLAVLQEDGRGREVFDPLIETYPGVVTRWFTIDVGNEEWTSDSRLTGIIIGRNLIVDYALRNGHDWIYFADSDIEAPDDVLLKLLELDHPVVGANIESYCLDGPRVLALGRLDVRKHWNSAGSLLVRRNVFSRVPWRYNPDLGETDDPATQNEMERLGYPTLVRHDVICRHHPETLVAFEDRGLDRTVYR